MLQFTTDGFVRKMGDKLSEHKSPLVQLESNATWELQLRYGEGTRSTALVFILVKLIITKQSAADKKANISVLIHMCNKLLTNYEGCFHMWCEVWYKCINNVEWSGGSSTRLYLITDWEAVKLNTNSDSSVLYYRNCLIWTRDLFLD